MKLLTFKQFINENYDEIKILTNPSRLKLQGELNKIKSNYKNNIIDNEPGFRGIWNKKTNDVHFSDSSKTYHALMLDALGIKDEEKVNCKGVFCHQKDLDDMKNKKIHPNEWIKSARWDYV